MYLRTVLVAIARTVAITPAGCVAGLMAKGPGRVAAPVVMAVILSS